MNLDKIRHLAGIQSSSWADQLQENTGAERISMETILLEDPPEPVSVEASLQRQLRGVLEQIEGKIPAKLKRDGVSYQTYPGAAHSLTARGVSVGSIIPTITKITVESNEDPNFVTATIDYDNGVYPVGEYRKNVQQFQVERSRPLSDLVGQVERWLQSQVGG